MTIRVEFDLPHPSKLLRPFVELVEDELRKMVFEQQISRADWQKAADGMVQLIRDDKLLKFALSLDDAKASIVIELQDDGAAREMMRAAAYEAVKLK